MKSMYAGVAIGTALLLVSTSEVAFAAPTGIKNVVLVHGAFADGSGWDAVAKILAKDGYKVSVAQPPETSYADDQKYTRAAIDAMGGPVVLVGPQLRRINYLRGRQRSERCVAGLHRRLRP
jgi:hypothetical protein